MTPLTETCITFHMMSNDIALWVRVFSAIKAEYPQAKMYTTVTEETSSWFSMFIPKNWKKEDREFFEFLVKRDLISNWQVQ